MSQLPELAATPWSPVPSIENHQDRAVFQSLTKAKVLTMSVLAREVGHRRQLALGRKAPGLQPEMAADKQDQQGELHDSHGVAAVLGIHIRQLLSSIAARRGEAGAPSSLCAIEPEKASARVQNAFTPHRHLRNCRAMAQCACISEQPNRLPAHTRIRHDHDRNGRHEGSSSRRRRTPNDETRLR